MARRDNSTVGTKLGPKLAMLVTQSVIYAHSRLAHVKHRVAMMVFHAISDEISEEVDVTMGPFIAKLHDQLTPDHPAYPAIHFLHTASGQLKAIAGSGLQISGLLGSISTVMNNELAPSVYGLVGSNPHLLPDVNTILQLAAAQQVSQASAIQAVADQGIDSGWANAMLTITKSWPDIQTGLELVRRGVINTDQVATWAAFNGIDETVTGYLLQLLDNPISPADAALALLRGDITQAQANTIATQNGITEDNFNILVGNTGEPPGLEQLLEAYRRGFIDEATLVKGIEQSRYRNEWIPTLEQLAYQPMSVADAVNATVQNQLDQDDAATIAQQNGLEASAFPVLLATAGEPLSRTEMEELYNRGLVSEDDVIQALRESRLKNKYNDLAFDLHARLLPVSSISAAMRVGAITLDQAVAKTMELGYSQEDATIAVNSGINSKIQQYRDRIAASLITLVEDGILAPADALTSMAQIGYSTEEAQFAVDSASFHLQAKYLGSAVTEVRSKFVSHHITQQAASGSLDSMGIPSAQRDYMLNIWAIEAAANVNVPSGTQIAKALENGVITQDQATQRLEELGYSSGDAAIVLGSE